MERDSGGATARGHRTRVVVQVLLGIALLVYGVALWTDTVTTTPPASVYILASVGLFAYAAVLLRRS